MGEPKLGRAGACPEVHILANKGLQSARHGITLSVNSTVSLFGCDLARLYISQTFDLCSCKVHAMRLIDRVIAHIMIVHQLHPG